MPGTAPRRPGDALGAVLRLAVGTVILASASGAALPAEPLAGSPSLPVALEDFVALTDDYSSMHWPGCDAITVLDSSSVEVVARGEWKMSPGQLAVTSDGTLIAALLTGGRLRNGLPFVNVLKWEPGAGTWENAWIGETMFAMGGAIAISPDDETLLVAGYNHVLRFSVEEVTLESLGGVVLSPALNPRLEGPPTVLSPIPSAIEFTADSRTAYVIADDGNLYTLDVGSMSWRGTPLAYAVPEVRKADRTRFTHASLSPDERWLLINTGTQENGRINVVDLARQAVSLVKPEGVAESWGVEFNYTECNRGLLAIHGRSAVGVYEFSAGELRLVAGVHVPPSQPRREWPDGRFARSPSLAWTGDGIRLIVRRGAGLKEWRLLELTSDEPRRLELISDFDTCTDTRPDSMVWLEGFDVVTLQDRLHRPTLTPSPEATASPTPSVTTTPSPKASGTPTATLTATVTPSPTITRVPRVLYFPLVLKEKCDPILLHADVVLVIDASTSMLEQTREKRTKLAAAVEAVKLFLDELALPLDQASVVEFNGRAELLQPLTGDRRALIASLNRLEVRRQTRIDLGVAVAREELASSRRHPDNQAVMIVLTDGKANPVGPGAAVREADAAKAEEVTIFTIGLGEDLDLDALESIADRPSYFYRAPDAEDLAEIYSGIAIEIPCPAEDFWGRR